MVSARKSRISRGVNHIRREGFLSFLIILLTKFKHRLDSVKQKDDLGNIKTEDTFHFLVREEDLIKVDWVNNPYVESTIKREKLKVVSWIIPPPGNGGGHHNIFRFIDHLDANDYINHVYVYTTNEIFKNKTVEDFKSSVKGYSNSKNTKFHIFKGEIVDSDIVFATSWETAYAVFNLDTQAKKFYFVQDFEPYFYAVGTQHLLAKNTYKFGFTGITAGKWLEKKLHDEYGMKAYSYDFSADLATYSYKNSGRRKAIFFYARPVTERRAFEMGILALKYFHERNPEYEIHFAGWDIDPWDIKLPHYNHGILDTKELCELYNKCSAALVMSLTNMSLLPLELLACGVIPVVNNLPGNTMNSDNEYIRYAENSPIYFARELEKIVRTENITEIAEKAANTIPKVGWKHSLDKFFDIVDSETTIKL